MNDLDLFHLEHALKADAAFISTLVIRGDQPAVSAYMRKTNYLERMQAWKAAQQ